MAGRKRMALSVAVMLFVLGNVAVFHRSGEAAGEGKSVIGIVEFVNGTVIQVAGKSLDLKGVPVRNAQGLTPVEISSLPGKTVEVVFRNRKVDSVTVYRTLPQ